MRGFVSISKSWNTVFQELLSDSRHLDFASPFIKTSAVQPIVECDMKVRGITVLAPTPFVRGASDIEALELLLERKAKLRSLRNLHSKLFIFDSAAVVTSANLTEGGLRRNIEYGVLIPEGEVFQKVKADFNQMFSEGHAIKTESLLVVKRIIENTPREMKNWMIKATDDIFPDKQVIIDSLSGWKKEVYLVIQEISKEEFVLQDVYDYKDHFAKRYPNNKHIEDKIRQILQYLRDDGLIEFVDYQGTYRF